MTGGEQERQGLLPTRSTDTLDELQPSGRDQMQTTGRWRGAGGGGGGGAAAAAVGGVAVSKSSDIHTANVDSASLSWTMRRNSFQGAEAWSLQILGAIFLFLIWWLVISKMGSPHKVPLFGWHPLLQSLGFVLLIQSTSILQPTQGSRPKEKGAAAKVHRWLNLVVAFVFTAGASIMWYLHSPASHFISWHGILGTSVVVWMWIQAVIGAVTVYPAGQKVVGGQARAKSLWKWHRLSGYLLLPAFLITLFTGSTQTSWAQQSFSTVYRIGITLLLLAIFAVGARRIQFNKLPKLT